MNDLPKVTTVRHDEAAAQGFYEHSICGDVALLPQLQADLLEGGCSAVVFSQIPKTAEFVVWVKMP